MDFQGFAGLYFIVTAILQTIQFFTQKMEITEASDYTVTVTPTCPAKVTNKGFATVKILTDLPDTQPIAFCKGNKKYDFYISPDGLWEMKVYFHEIAGSQCVFQKNTGTAVYRIDVEVPESKDLILARNAPHVVSCTYDPTGIRTSTASQFSDGLQPIDEIQQHMATVSKSDVVLCAADMSGNCLLGAIRLGKTIQLKAELIGNIKGEVSFQALSCKAVAGSSTYSVIVGGCGDGVVFPKKNGFTTKAKIATSPYFKSFRLPGSKTVDFDCTFVVCDQNCDGSSCSLEGRTKRSTTTKVSTTTSEQTKT